MDRVPTPLESLLSDAELVEEIRSLGTLPGQQALPEGRIVPTDSIHRLVEGVAAGRELALGADPWAEAIIRDFGRPVLRVRNGTIDPPASGVWRRRLLPGLSNLHGSISSVGRVELFGHPTLDWVGTAWMVSEDVAVTNRHVAREFAGKENGRFAFLSNPFGQTMQAAVDFREEYGGTLAEEFQVIEVLWIEEVGPEFPDLALIRITKDPGLPAPIPLRASPPEVEFVAVVGYPARDSRNDAKSMTRIFGDIYDVKRFAPGKITSFPDGVVFTHDCSTLGGNSGSAVIDIDTGAALGLHFGGRFHQANFAVKASVVAEKLRDLNTSVAFPTVLVPRDEVLVERREATEYRGRVGYDKSFLGRGYEVDLPALGELEDDATPVGGDGHELCYTHFSVVMNRPRRLAFYTACNIDGRKLRRFPRDRDRWYIDPRIDQDAQLDNSLYKANDLDRGHLVRRLDPVWGEEDEALLAQEDTFHYTNAAPQHKYLNRGSWVDLEDYILDNSEVHDLKVSVLTGPIFRRNDQRYRGIRLPRAFWKVVVIRTGPDKRLSATGYLLSQADMIRDLEFAFGAFRTYQVPIARIERDTKLEFGPLREHDPLAGVEEREVLRELRDVSQIVI